MIGLIYPGVNRLDYHFDHEGGFFPQHIESNNDPAIARWLEAVIHMVPVAPRPEGYNPLGVKNLDPQWIRRLGQTGKDCYDAILARDAKALGASMNECMKCWEAILPHTVRHPTISAGPAGDSRPIPGEIRGGHVFRLRRRICVCGVRDAGSRRDTRHRQDRRK